MCMYRFSGYRRLVERCSRPFAGVLRAAAHCETGGARASPRAPAAATTPATPTAAAGLLRRRVPPRRAPGAPRAADCGVARQLSAPAAAAALRISVE